MNRLVAFVFLAGELFLAGCSTKSHQASANETKISFLAPTHADAELKKYAENGWVLVGVVTGTPVSPTGELCGYLLKRPK
ncbi:MAG TPA: hypothetical protein VGJ73_03840 [Verrucomicrobiae bacterium]|jgi:hypothetical protein